MERHYTRPSVNTSSYIERKKHLVAVFEDTLLRIEHDSELQKAIKHSICNQIFIPDSDELDIPAPRYVEDAQIIVSQNRSLEAAANYREQKTAVLNFASATSPGGGVRSGASAQEESLCRVSTLYPCLKDRKMWEKFYYPHHAFHNSLHNDDIIYTPNIVVIKDDDYHPLQSSFVVDIITCAAPNLRQNPSSNMDPNTDIIDISCDTLLKIHEKRARKIITTAANYNAEVLILGAFGCGAFCNNPKIVATAYHNVLPLFLKHFKFIEFAIYCSANNLENYMQFKEVFPSSVQTY